MDVYLRKILRPSLFKATFIFGAALFGPVLAPYMASLGISDIWISIILGAYPLTVILTSSFLGKLSDIIGRKKVIFWAIALRIFSCLLYYYAGAGWEIGLARILQAISFFAISLPILAEIEDILRDENRGFLGGLSFSLVEIGSVLGPLAGAWLADYWFVRAPFLVSGLVTIFSLAWLIKWQEKPRNGLVKKRKIRVFGGLKRYLKNKGLRGMAILGFFTHASHPAQVAFLPLFILRILGGSYTQIGWIFFALALFLLLGQAPAGALSDKKGRIGVVVTGTFIIGASWILMGSCQNFFWLFLIALLHSLGGAMWNSGAWAYMGDISDRADREGEVAGVYISLAKIGEFLGFLVSGFIAVRFGIPFLFMLNGGLIIMASFVSVFFLKSKRL